MIAFSLAVICGTALAFWGNTLVELHWISYLPLFLLLAWLHPRFRFFYLCCSTLLWASLLLHQSIEQRPGDELDGQSVLLSGTIIDISEQRKHSVRFYLKPDYLQSYSRRLPEKIRLSWYRSQQIPQAGQRWQLLVKLRKPRGFQNPDAFDYERWLFVKGIAANGYVKKSGMNRKIAEADWYNIDRYRLQIVEAIDRACNDCKHHGLFKALTVGFRGDIPDQQGKLLRDTGTAHLLAISGLHIGLVAGLFFLLGNYIWRLVLYRSRFNRLECSAMLAMVAALAYAALAGFSIPTVRALLMLIVVLLALLLRKGVNLLNSIACAVTLILLLDPLAIGSASFWLSISALLVIALGQFLLVNEKNRLKQLLVIQLLFSLLFIPLGILLFNQASPAGFLANIVAIPVLSFVILPTTLISSLLSIFDIPLAAVLFAWLDHLTGWLLDYLQILLTSGLQAFQYTGLPLLLLCLAIGLILMLLPIGWRARMPALVLLPVALMWQPADIETGSFRLSVLDVGMGTAVVVETENHNLIYDFGPGNSDGFSAGEWVVKPYLRYRGIEQSDLMVISHVDSDHSGGFISFLDENVVARLVTGTPGMLEKRFNMDKPIRNCHDYPAWRWDGIDFEFLATLPRHGLRSSNNSSCVLKVSGIHTALLSGDIEAEQEYRLLNQLGDKLAADILLVPHHGSLTSSTNAFVNTVSASVAIFTLGRNNRWGFPKSEVLERYQKTATNIFRTDRDGAISLLSQPEELQIRSQRQFNRIWHDNP